jgi:hypothetical protein
MVVTPTTLSGSGRRAASGGSGHWRFGAPHRAGRSLSLPSGGAVAHLPPAQSGRSRADQGRSATPSRRRGARDRAGPDRCPPRARGRATPDSAAAPRWSEPPPHTRRAGHTKAVSPEGLEEKYARGLVVLDDQDQALLIHARLSPLAEFLVPGQPRASGRASIADRSARWTEASKRGALVGRENDRRRASRIHHFPVGRCRIFRRCLSRTARGNPQIAVFLHRNLRT